MRTKKQILTAIQHVAVTGKGLDDAVQSIGLDILQHVDANGEVSLAIKLLRALPKGARAKALADWFQKYGKIAVNTDKDTAKQFPLVFNREGKTDLEGAAAKPWYKCRPDRPLAVEFDFAKQLSALLQRAAEAEAKGLAIKGADILDKLRAMNADPVTERAAGASAE